MNRRDFLSGGLWLASAAGAVTTGFVPKSLRAQNKAKTIRTPGRYENSLIIERKRSFSWPNGKTLAVWIIPNVEVAHFDPMDSGTKSSTGKNPADPGAKTYGWYDTKTYAWKEYGLRVGLWRIAEVMAAAGIRATVALNAGVCEVFPRAIEEMKRLDWEFMGHGTTNSLGNTRLRPRVTFDQERESIQTILGTVEQATGKRPRGWLRLAETDNTPDILAEQGVLYTGDWYNDDQPYPLKVKKGSLVSMPYCMEINDTQLYGYHRYTGSQYLAAITDQFDQLYEESRKLPMVFGIPVHSHLTGAALRIKYFKQLIAHMQQRGGVWFATGSEILEAYQSSQA